MGCCGAKESPGASEKEGKPEKGVAAPAAAGDPTDPPVPPPLPPKAPKEREKDGGDNRRNGDNEVKESPDASPLGSTSRSRCSADFELGENVDVVFFPDESLPPEGADNLERSVEIFGADEGALSKLLEQLCEVEWRLDVCLSQLNSQHVMDVLVALANNGAQIRVVFDSAFDHRLTGASGTRDEDVLSILRTANVDVREWSNEDSTMNHQFMVLDNVTVVTGSFEWTDQAALTHHTAVVFTKGRKIAERFEMEFNRLWEEARPMAETYTNKARSGVARIDKPSKILFFPDWAASRKVTKHDTALTSILKFLYSAKSTLDVAVSRLEEDEITEAVFDSAKKGVEVRVLLDVRSKVPSFRPDADTLTIRGLSDMQHHFVIVDGRVIATGSYRWTSTATTTYHQNCMMHPNEELAQKFKKEFDQLFSGGKTL